MEVCRSEEPGLLLDRSNDREVDVLNMEEEGEFIGADKKPAQSHGYFGFTLDSACLYSSLYVEECYVSGMECQCGSLEKSHHIYHCTRSHIMIRHCEPSSFSVHRLGLYVS